MKKYHVLVREIWIQKVEIEAENAGEAIEKVADGDGEYLDNALEYADTMASDTWTAEEVNHQ